jgi:hypothetical protein
MKEFPDIDLSHLDESIAESVRASVEGFRETFGNLEFGPAIGETEVTEQELPVEPGSSLAVRTTTGHIDVRAADRSTIKIRAESRGGLDLSSDGRLVSVQPRAHGGHQAELDIEVPRDCSVEVHTVKADVSVAGTRAPLRIETTDGDVEAADITADCRFHTVGGDVEARRLTGALTVHTTNGDIEVLDSRLRGFRLESTNGDFRIESPLPPEETYFVKTVNGDVRLSVPEGTGIAVELRTLNGEVTSELPTEVTRASKRRWEGRINGGGAKLEMESLNGDLRIDRFEGRAAETMAATEPRPSEPAPREPAPAVPPAPPEPYAAPAASEDAGAVRAALERGEISVDEAMEKLDALG